MSLLAGQGDRVHPRQRKAGIAFAQACRCGAEMPGLVLETCLPRQVWSLESWEAMNLGRQADFFKG